MGRQLVAALGEFGDPGRAERGGHDIPPVTLNRALVLRHGSGRSDTYDAALLDVAQDHLLWLLAETGLFDDHDLVFKGGTSLRKCGLGGAGRFSTDLDFAAPNDDIVLAVCEIVDRPVELAAWERRVRQRFGFLADLDQDERRWTPCDPRYRDEIQVALSKPRLPAAKRTRSAETCGWSDIDPRPALAVIGRPARRHTRDLPGGRHGAVRGRDRRVGARRKEITLMTTSPTTASRPSRFA